VLLCIWWDQQGVVHYKLLQPDEMVTAQRYQQQMIHDALEEKKLYTDKERKKVILLQDNARAHTAIMTLRTITDLDWEILSHPAYSPDFAPSDYHLFRSLQHHLTDTHFTYVKDVEKSMVEFINSKQSSFVEVEFGSFPKDGASV